VFVESPLQNTQGFYSVAPTFRFMCLIFYCGLLCYLHKVKAHCGGSDLTSETKSLNLVLFDIGRFTLKRKMLIGLFSFDIMPKANSPSF